MRVLEQGAQLADRYTLVRKLGSGGMSETWLAQDRQTGKSVALKFLSQALAGNSGFRKLLRAEWQLGSRLMHANIVRVFEYHDDADQTFFSLQYIGGPDIGVLAGEDIDVVSRPIGLIADALRYAHGKNIVHRDIKASNVLLDPRGAPYLIDFGVAATPGDAATGGSSIASSPQQLAGEPPRPQDDIYGLGVLIYELVSGGPPDPNSTPMLSKSGNGNPVPASVSTLVSEMLAIDPQLRPNAESVAARLREAGLDPGLVPGRFIGAGAMLDVEPVEPTIRPRERRPLPPAEAVTRSGSESGISPRVMGGAVAAALILFLAVVFFLPRVVDKRDGDLPGSDNTATGSEGVASDDEDEVLFNENVDEFATREDRLRLKYDTEQALGELLSKMETLQARAVDRWGGQVFKDAQEIYAEGDQEYLRRNYRIATEKYREAITVVEPLLQQVDETFEETMNEGRSALEAGDSAVAMRSYELAVAISPGHTEAHTGLTRARNLDLVMSLTKQGTDFEKDLDLDAAQVAFEKALELDAEWPQAMDGLQRVLVAINQMSFDLRMSEGLEALADGDFPTARAAFRTAQALQPESREPADGLLQVDQGIRLQKIADLEDDAIRLEKTEQWDAAIQKYEAILEVDTDLAFAHEGLSRSKERSDLHKELDAYIADPDSLSDPAKMQVATALLLDITRMPSVGPRLEDRKNQLSQLLKRAVTPLTVRLLSDNATDVVIFRVGKLGSFESQEISLRPGTYVATGSRPGYRDVRLEFRVSPETELQPVVVRCEEQI